jgi:Clp amino terminal domain, pathogenicity island component
VFERFSPRARRIVFWSVHYSRLAGSPYIEPEHILEGLLHEDPLLFTLILPEQPSLVNDLRTKLASTRGVPITEKRDTPLSPPGKAIIVAAANEQYRLGHPHVTSQHVLLALLTAPAPSSSWFGKRKEWPVQKLLSSYGLTLSLVDEKTKEGIITTATWVLDDPVCALNAELGALVDLFIAKGLFTRAEYVSLLDQHDGPLPPQTFLLPLMSSMEQKGILTPEEHARILSPQSDSEKKSPDSPINPAE